LKGARSLGDVEAALTALTESSDKELTVYDRAMDRIDSQAPKDTELAHRVLSWIVESKRPLTHEELNHALAIKTGHIKFDREYLQHNLDDTVALCAGLIVINQKSNTVQLMHHTTRKYFEDYKTRSDWLKAAAGMLASACLTYVSYSEFAKGPCSDDRPLERRLRIYPFLEYAAQHWGNHARDDSARTADVEELALNFLEDSEKVNSSNQVMYLTEQRYEGYSQEYTRHANGLHIAAFFGLRKIAERLIFNGADVKETDEGGTTAMHLAAENGHDEVVLVLVKNGANIDARETKYGQTPLHLAALNGHKAVAETLLQNDALANLKDHEGWMAIHVAVWTGKGEVVQVLLESIDVNETGKDKLTALHCAAAQGHKILAQLLIDKKANVNAEDSDGWTPLHWASKKRHDIMKPRMLTIHDKPSELLRQIVAKQEEMRTLLRQQTIIIQDKLAVIKNPLAVWHGRLAWLPPEIGLDMMDGRYDDVVATLHFATTVQDIVLPNSSRERNEQPTAPSRLIFAIQDELTALHCSIECGHEPVGRLLLENGADIDGECKTKIEVKFGFKVDVKPNALHLAAFSGHEAMVRLLLEQGADVHAKCITGLPITFTDPIKMIQDFDELPHAELNAMHFAVMSGNDEIVELLIRKRADIQTTCLISAEDVRLELTPLHLAVVWGHVKLVQQLLSNGASVNARCEMSFQVKFKVRGSNMSVKSFMIRTDLSALHLAILSRRIDVIELLLKNKADIQTKVHVNLGPVYLQLPSLHIALLCAQSEVVTLLLESEANVRAELLISKGEKMLAKITVLHLATLVRETDVARQLIEKGADIHARFTIDINDWKPFRRRERHKSELQPEDPEESPMKGAIKRALRHTLQLVGAFIGEEIADFSLIKKATGIYREHSEDIQKVHIELTALHLAAMLGRNELLKLYVEKGVDPNVTFSVNFSDNQSNIVMTALHLAILWNHQETTELLLNSGANIHVQLSINLFNVLHVKATVLQLTVVSGSPELVRLVLDRGSNINTECHVTVGKVHTKITALHLAILLQKEETAYLLVGQGIDVKSSLLVQIGGHDIEFKAIHLAAATGSEGVVQLLLDNGYTGNEYGRVGNGTENQLTALHFAVAFSHEPVARLLINNGADVSTKLCVKLDSLLDVELTILHLAVMSGNLNMIQLLFDNGIVADSKGKVATHKGRAELTGLTELHLAALWNRQEIIEQLLKADSDVHATCFITVEGGLRAEFTLLHIAAVVGNKDTVKTLLGAQLNPQTRAVLIGNSIHTELTTLHLAVLWRRLGAAEILLDAGGGAQDDCLLKIQSFQIKLTSVHIAVLWRHHPMFRLLLEKEINVLSNLQITGPDTYAELSALHAAALYREPRMFHTLLQYGADANARFQFDFDEGYADVGVLHLVAALGSYNMMSTLLSTAPLGDYPSPALPPRSRFRSRSRSRSRRFSYSSSYLSLSSYSRSRSGSPSRPLSRSRSRSHSRGRMPVRRLRLRTSQPLESRSLARSRSESRVIGRSPARFESRSESLSPTRQRSHQFSVSPSKPRFTTRSRSRSLTQERIPRRGRNLNRHRASHSRSLSVSSQNVHSPGPSNKHSDKSSQNSEYPDTQENRTSIKTALPQPDIPAGDTPEEQSRRNSRGSSSRISRQKTRETFRKSYSDISAQPPNLRERTSKADVDAPFLLNIGKMHIQLSAIHIAALFRSTQKMQLLLDNNVDVNTLLEYNTENIRVELTPVQVAILSKSDSMIENLIETGADIHTVLKVATSDAYLELSTLHLAALASKIPATTDASRIDVVELLLKVGADVQRNCPIGVRKKVQTEITLLHLVILSAQDELTDLLSKGVDVRTKAMANLEIWLHSALTPLDVAALLNDEFLMEVFQDKGAKPMHEDRADSYVNSIRQLAHLLAAATGIQRLEEFVLSSINSIDEPFKIKLQAKMETAFPVTLQAPVESAFDINLEVELSALPLAAALGNMKVIDVLIQKGADLDTVCKINVGETTHTELTALHLATIWKTDEAMNLLLEKGANPLAMGQVKFTGTIQKQLIAPHLTTLVGHDGFLRLLKKNNEIETKIQVQLTVLHLAALLDDTIVAGLILDHGIDANLECLVNIEAKASTTFEANVLVQLTALHVAAWAGHDRIVLLLLKNGASVDSTIRVGGKAALGPGLRVNRKIQAGGTALHLAAGLGHEKIVQILINNGANIYCKSQDGRTAMQWASSNKHEAVMRLIHAKKQSLDSQKKRSHNESLATGHDDNKRFLERVQSMLSKDNPSADTNEGRDNTSLTQTGDLPHQNANVYRKEGVARYLMRLVAEKADNGIHKMRRGIFSDPDPETDQAETENIPEESPDDPLD
jgi:ankyrin repeat protein